VNSRPTNSLTPEFFDEMYADTHDPWGFETREYEAKKYAATLAALPRDQYSGAFEIGCSVGVLTEQLAERCDSLLAVDVVETPLKRARRRCQHLSHVTFEMMQVPDEFSDGMFDLIMLSEVAYYWAGDDLERGRDRIIDHLQPGGHLVMVHWRPFVEEYPRTGDEVHEFFLETTSDQLDHLCDRRQDLYRLDVFARR
jgi:predicted TPR repeat methyltransferase